MGSCIVQLRKGLIEYCVMKCLGKGESYGYEIATQLKTMESLAITESSVYPILSRLKKEGYLKVRAVKSAAGPPRRYYALTQAGEARLQEMNSYWMHLVESVEHLGQKDTKS